MQSAGSSGFRYCTMWPWRHDVLIRRGSHLGPVRRRTPRESRIQHWIEPKVSVDHSLGCLDRLGELRRSTKSSPCVGAITLTIVATARAVVTSGATTPTETPPVAGCAVRGSNRRMGGMVACSGRPTPLCDTQGDRSIAESGSRGDIVSIRQAVDADVDAAGTLVDDRAGRADGEPTEVAAASRCFTGSIDGEAAGDGVQIEFIAVAELAQHMTVETVWRLRDADGEFV